MRRKRVVRRPVGLRLSPTEEAPVIEVAEAEFDGCLSVAIRALIAEAIEARRAARDQR